MRWIGSFARQIVSIAIIGGLFYFSLNLALGFESLVPLGVWAIAVVTVIYWNILKPDPDFVPLRYPFYFKSRREESFWIFVTFTAWLSIPVGGLLNLWLDLGLNEDHIVIPVAVFGLCIIIQISLAGVRSRTKYEIPSVPKLRTLGSFFGNLVWALGFFSLVFVAGNLGGEEPGWWMMLPFGWLISGMALRLWLDLRLFKPRSSPLFFANRKFAIFTTSVLVLGALLWSIGVVLVSLGNPYHAIVLVLGAVLGGVATAILWLVRWKNKPSI